MSNFNMTPQDKMTDLTNNQDFLDLWKEGLSPYEILFVLSKALPNLSLLEVDISFNRMEDELDAQAPSEFIVGDLQL